jgi:hypothetical protein
LKKSQNQKNLISEKTWQKILYKIGVSKSIIREAEISTPTSLKLKKKILWSNFHDLL